MSGRDGNSDQPDPQSSVGVGQIRPSKLIMLDLFARADKQNFVEIDEDEDDVDMNGDDEDDDFDDGEYSDDEDDSWKIRRSAAKLLQSIFGTRLELLLDFYDNAAGVLISKFNEREESVRVEVLTAFEVLLNQTAIARTAELASGGRNKRKRSHDMDEDSAQDDS
jgi:cullin-associated NEDD8-dissociated protein 1